jgi:anti-sigma-K factor RskA
MTDDDEIDGLAAEYVLGSLDPIERKEVDVRRKVDVTLDGAVKAWEKRLGPLSDLLPGAEPRPDLFLKIANQLWGPHPRLVGPAQASFQHKGTKRRLALSAGACALAACLAMVVVWVFQASPGFPAKLIAELQRNTDTADGATMPTVPLGFVVYFDLRASTMTVSPLAVPPGSRRDYQLWLIPRDAGPPISLGIIALAEPTQLPWLATYPPYDLVHTKLSVSLEPKGGAPNGIPTGPTMFAGRVVQAMP